jgi:hypothetical protein
VSYVIAAPEFVAAAASDLANIGSTINAANVAATLPTIGVLPAGTDEVSAVIAAMFGTHAQAYQALSAQAASFHSAGSTPAISPKALAAQAAKRN